MQEEAQELHVFFEYDFMLSLWTCYCYCCHYHCHCQCYRYGCSCSYSCGDCFCYCYSYTSYSHAYAKSRCYNYSYSYFYQLLSLRLRLRRGSLLGHPAFIQAAHPAGPDQLPKLPDFQCAWRLLLLCASPRANRARTMPPWHTPGDMMMMPSGRRCRTLSGERATAEATAPAACWAASASWAMRCLPSAHCSYV